jgi:glycine cleavage system regulatory protein
MCSSLLTLAPFNGIVETQTSTAHGTCRFFATKEVIINAVASDRVGIVSELTKYVTDVGGNVGESQASRLGSHFSIMMLVHIPENKVVSLVDLLEDVENITASVHMVQSKESPISNAEIACK